jgi:amino acid transporter
MAGFRRSLGTIETFGFSLSIIAPTLAMAFSATLAVQSAGWAAPLAYLISGMIVAIVALSFVTLSRRVADAGSVCVHVGSVLGPPCGFVAGWVLLLTCATFLAGSTALVRNFGAAALGHIGIEGASLWLIIAMLAMLIAVWLIWRDMQLSARVMLVLESASVLAILVLAIVILARAPLSRLAFNPDR